MSTGARFVPPQPVGEPYRGDPRRTPSPFVTDRELEASAAGTPAVAAPHLPTVPPASGAPAWGAPPSNPSQPTFTTAGRTADPTTRSDESYAKIGLGIAIASLFVLGPVLGPIGIVMGAQSIRRGQAKLGAWAIAAGATGTILSIVMMILFALGVISMDDIWNGQ